MEPAHIAAVLLAVGWGMTYVAFRLPIVDGGRRWSRLRAAVAVCAIWALCIACGALGWAWSR